MILNECKYAEKCLEENNVGENLFKTLPILARYFSHKMGYSTEKIEDELLAFTEKNYKGYYKKRLYINSFIEKISSGAKDTPLREIDGVWITKKELNVIRSIGDSSAERLLFSLLCYAKFNIAKNPKSNGWINDAVSEIFTVARISPKSEDRAKMIRDLIELGYVEKFKKGTKINYRVTIVDKKGKGELFIDDFRELGYEYLKYCGQNFIRCAECGVLTRGNKAGTKRYCSSCAAYEPVKPEILQCVDCGAYFFKKPRSSNRDRCANCYKIFRKCYIAEKVKKHRNTEM